MKMYKSLSAALKEREEVRFLKLTLKSAEFPLEIFDLPHLEELHLDGACVSFPKKIEGLQELKTFSAKWEKFSGDLSSLFSLPKLENLKLIETPLASLLLPMGLVVAPLKFLSIKSCGIKTLPEEISMLTVLQELHLPHNQLTSLPHSFQELHALSRLNLDQNQFSKFPLVFRNMPKLKHLSIDGNLFDEEEKAFIQREFHIWPS